MGLSAKAGVISPMALKVWNSFFDFEHLDFSFFHLLTFSDYTGINLNPQKDCTFFRVLLSFQVHDQKAGGSHQAW